jgi:hypothetical protein
MPLSNSPMAYTDIRTAMDRALQSDKGIRVKIGEAGKAIHFRQKCYKLRLLDRKNSLNIYPKDHPMHGVSAYDSLVITVVPEIGEVLIQRTDPDNFTDMIEEIE